MVVFISSALKFPNWQVFFIKYFQNRFHCCGHLIKIGIFNIFDQYFSRNSHEIFVIRLLLCIRFSPLYFFVFITHFNTV
jgi:hypothetical protein